MGVTVFKFEYPGSMNQFIEKVNAWMTATNEGKRYHVKESEEGMILKIQRGKGIMTAPIVIEFKEGAALGLPTEMQVKGYVHVFGLKNIKQDLRPDAKITAIPRRNGWKDVLKLLDHADVSNYEHNIALYWK